MTAHLPRGQVQSYRLADSGSHQLRILLEVDDPAFSVSVCSPDGRVSKLLSGIPVGASLMYVPAVQAGTYTVKIGTPDRGQELAYRVRWDAAPYEPAHFARSLAAEEALRSGSQLRRQSTPSNIRRAVKYFEQAGRDFAAVGDLHGQRLALLARGDAELRISNYAEALSSYRMALEIQPGQGAAALVSLARVYVEQQQIPNAAEYSEQALLAARKQADRRLESAALTVRGQALFLQSKDADAMLDFTAALELAQAERDRPGIAEALEGLANAEADTGRLRSAAEHLAQAEDLWRAVGDVHNEVADLNVRTLAMAMTGSREQSLRTHRTAAQLLERMGDRRRAAAAIENVGESYIALNQPRIALAYVERSVAEFQALHLNGGRFQGLLQLCLAYHALGETASALRACRSAAEVVPLLHDPRQLSLSSRVLAEVQMSLGQPGAEHLLASAVELSRVAKDPRGEANALRSLGRLHAANGDNGAALRLFEQALPLSEAGEDPEGVIAAHFQMARVQRASGNLDNARTEVEAALQLAEAQRAKVGSDALRASYFTSMRESYELYAQVLIDLHKQRPGAGLDRVALEQSEKAHARTLLDSLVERNAELTEARDPETARRMRNLRSQSEAASSERMRLLAYGGSRKQLDDNIERIRLLNAEYDTLRSSTAGAAASAAASIPSATVDQIQNDALDPDTTLLEYLLGDEGGIGWAVTQQQVVWFALPPRSAIESDVRRWHALMLARKPRPADTAETYSQRVRRADGELRTVGAKLGCALVGPVLSDIKTRRLVIVPDGSLESLSFAALPLSPCEHRAADPLAARFEVTVAPSASSIVALRRELQRRPAPAPRIAVLADPVFTADDPRVPGKHAAAKPMHPSGALAAAMRDLGWNTGIPRLPGTRLEAATIKAHDSAEALVRTDFDASLSTALRPELARYRILHFATHGLLDSDQPEFSGLILSLVDRKGHDENGYLSAQDIYEQHLLSDLVVLSACDSGLGPTLRGEGVVGLARAFLHAGAARVVSSLWKVDDEATSELMRHFYDGVLRDHKAPAGALRYAQLQMMHQKRWAAPFYWAGFVLDGEWR